jgi:hypothetical protein
VSRSTFLARLSALEAAVLPRPQVQVPDAVEMMARAIGQPDDWQVQVLREPAPRALWLCCRQSGKSTTTAVLALHQALTQPESLIILLSPSLRQSQELFKKVVYTYRALGNPSPLQAESALRYEINNGSWIIALPGTEPNIRGYSSVDLLVIDEAARVQDELYFATRPMLAVSGGRLVCLSTPFGRRGWFHQAWEQGEGWSRLKVDAYACPRIAQSFLEEEKRTLPDLWFRSEYLVEFVDVDSQLFGYDLVQAALSAEIAPLFKGSGCGLSPRV